MEPGVIQTLFVKIVIILRWFYKLRLKETSAGSRTFVVFCYIRVPCDAFSCSVQK